jgi:simple sugar transport system substrate-binding protein
MSRFKVLSFVMIVALLALAGCGATQEAEPTEAVVQPTAPEAAQPEAPQVTQADLSFGMAVHSNPAEDAFWAVVEKGAKDAAAQFGVDLISGGSSDPVEQAQLIENQIASGVDGIFVSLANPDALRDAVTKAVDAGIPVITINSGVDVYKELGALTHVGQTEIVAGQGAGEKFNTEGAGKVLCVIHEEGNIGLEQRCDGLAASLVATSSALTSPLPVCATSSALHRPSRTSSSPTRGSTPS